MLSIKPSQIHIIARLPSFELKYKFIEHQIMVKHILAYMIDYDGYGLVYNYDYLHIK